MKSSIAVSVAFLAGSVITATFFSWSKHEPASASVMSRGKEHTDVDAGLEPVYDRLTNIEMLLTQLQKQIRSAPQPINEASKHGDKDVLDVTTKAAVVNAGNAIVERVLQSGTVTPSDFNAFAAATVGLNNDERQQMLSKITMAINNGQMRVEPN